ncbi:manganese-dependent inorganic pyrophosphatase [Aerococcaceae bacterium zg-ZUI334]|uniref:manganese-dependent inorganic pyrophosphatase n=1 Tax=Aerococcaceae bacterium zg-252 TaxID=2796928 RepID=UPI001B9EEB63|nr:manganese-dependent inorganic pyrophosphatase [Aerococcaceae bacterium zg-ZUI334]
MSKYLVFGHKNPDTDTVASAIAMSFFLERTGYDAEPVILGPVNEETAFALDSFNVEAPRIVETVANEVERVALVDHNEPQQSVADLESVTVDYVVDHHRIAGFETAQPLYYRAEPIGCTATILFKMFKENEIDIPSSIAGLMLSAIISDTLLFKSPTCTKQDEFAARELAKYAEVDIEEYGLALLKAGTNLSTKSVEELLNLDAKTFEMNGRKVRIAQVNAIGFAEMKERKASLLEAMELANTSEQYDLFLLIVTDVLESNSFALVAGEDLKAVKRAFDTIITNQEFELPGVVSRKKQVVPQLTESYEAL